jgi:transposase
MPDLRTEATINDKLWERIAPLLPPKPAHPRGGRPFKDDRACFEGIVFVLRNGCRWSALAMIPDLPSPVTCWRRHRDWSECGAFDTAWAIAVQELGATGKLDLSELFADATFVEAQKGGQRSARQNAAKG